MANLYGIDIRTPEEIRAEQNALFQQQASQGDIGAYARQSIFNIFGSPELKKAQETQAALTNVMSEFKEDPGRDPLENEMERAKLIRDRLAKIDPTAAIQANDRFLQARTEFEQRNRLIADDKWKEKKREYETVDLEAAKTYALASGRLAVLQFDPETGAKKLYKALPAGASLEELQAELEKAQLEDPNGVFQGGRGSDALDPNTLFRPQRDDASGTTGQLKSGMRLDVESLRGFDNVMLAQQDLMDTILNDPDALNSWTREFESGFGSLITGLEAQAQKYGIDIGNNLEALQSYGVTSEEAQAKILTMAYKVAKALDPGGRLSNQDVEMAIRMVAGSGSPTAIANLMRSRLREYDNQVQQLEWAAEASGNTEQMNLVRAYKAKRSTLEETLDQFGENILAVRSAVKAQTQMGAAGGNVRTSGIVESPDKIPQMPEGIPGLDAATWAKMTPEERALFTD